MGTNQEKENERLARLKNIVANMPEKPGSYQFYNLDNVIIYVGKAKNLKNRVSCAAFHSNTKYNPHTITTHAAITIYNCMSSPAPLYTATIHTATITRSRHISMSDVKACDTPTLMNAWCRCFLSGFSGLSPCFILVSITLSVSATGTLNIANANATMLK